MEAQLLPVSNTTLDLQVLMNQTDILANLSAAARHEVAFLAVVPPLGYTTYTLAPAQDDQLSASSAARPAQRATQSRARAWVAGRRLDDNSTVDQALVQVSNGVLDLTADPVTGRVISLSRQGMNLATQLNTEVHLPTATPLFIAAPCGSNGQHACYRTGCEDMALALCVLNWGWS